MIKFSNYDVQEGRQLYEFTFCPFCDMAVVETNTMSKELHVHQGGFPFLNIEVIRNFVDENEEAMLVEEIDKQAWVLSQSGRRKQDYGPKVNFKRQKVQIGGFDGLPAYSRFLITRYNDLIKESKSLRPEFLPVELCNLEYKSDRGACIVPHYDDSWLWGDRLVTVNLSGATYLTFTLPTADVVDGINHEFQRVQSCVPNVSRGSFCVRVLLDRRSLVVVSGPARYIWQHEIRRSDIPIRRIAMTFRELSSTFSPESGNMTDEQKFGKKLLEIASTYAHM
ncbi:alkylated DNA repair protein alkB 4 [Schistosoma bovis]|uniref:Alkylated DNA repair protein alkB 4 n=1 Tax=Schistosoma bovis TaxID=6184 RepID=A0A430QDI6_SCHBO|nr:alkylated DNA repair protein alkB 4 [Schistosoma bovis]